MTDDHSGTTMANIKIKTVLPEEQVRFLYVYNLLIMCCLFLELIQHR